MPLLFTRGREVLKENKQENKTLEEAARKDRHHGGITRWNNVTNAPHRENKPRPALPAAPAHRKPPGVTPAQKGMMAGSHEILNQQIKTYKTTLGHVTHRSPPPGSTREPRQ